MEIHKNFKKKNLDSQNRLYEYEIQGNYFLNFEDFFFKRKKNTKFIFKVKKKYNLNK